MQFLTNPFLSGTTEKHLLLVHCASVSNEYRFKCIYDYTHRYQGVFLNYEETIHLFNSSLIFTLLQRISEFFFFLNMQPLTDCVSVK